MNDRKTGSETLRGPALKGVARRGLLSWLLAVTIEYLLLPVQERGLSDLAAVGQMSVLRVLCLMVGSFLLLCAASRCADTERAERWLMAGSFAVLSIVSLCANASFAFACAALVCLALLLAYAQWGQAAKAEPLAASERHRRPALCLTVAFTLLFFAFVSLWTVCRVLAYRTPTYDFGIFSQMFHRMRTTGLPTTTLERDGLLSHFAVHVSPIYYLLLPFYCLFPHPATLQVLQAALLASCAVPLWLLAKKHGFAPLWRAALCLLLFLYPAFSGGAAYDLHENAFLTPLLLWLFYAMDCKNPWLTALLALLTLTVKEDAAVYVAVAGLYLTVRSMLKPYDRKSLITGLVLMLSSVLWFFAVTTYLAKYGDGVMTYRYANFMPEGSSSLLGVVGTVLLLPMKLLSECTDADKLRFIALTLLPLLGLPLLTRKFERFFLLIPYLLVNLMPDYPYQHSIYFQYMFGSTAFLMYLTVLNLADLQRTLAGHRLCKPLPTLLALAMSLYCFSTTIPGLGAYYMELYWENRASYAQTDAFLRTIPKDAAVAATTFYTTPLSDRATLWDVKYASRAHLLSADYVLLDVNDTASYEKYGGLSKLIRFLQAQGYRETARLEDELILFQKMPAG